MRREQARVAEQLAAVRAENAALRARGAELQAAHDEAVRQREELREQIRPAASDHARRLIAGARSRLVGGKDSAR
jgi:hypothetical protein